MRILADSNIVALAVRTMRAARYDVSHSAERAKDPGDEALLAEAASHGQLFLTKDQGIGALVHRDNKPHAGVLLVDDLGDAAAETQMIMDALTDHRDRLLDGAFLGCTESGTREA